MRWGYWGMQVPDSSSPASHELQIHLMFDQVIEVDPGANLYRAERARATTLDFIENWSVLMTFGLFPFFLLTGDTV